MPLSPEATASSPATLAEHRLSSPLANVGAVANKLAAPSVSVVIPLYNHERYIEAALHSVWSQTMLPAEIIVIDDGSVDGSADKVRQLCKDHPEVIFWSWPNQGAHHTLNAGILRATGDFVAILNSDDCYEPERLAACLAAAQSDPSIDVVATGVSFRDDHGSDVSSPWYDDALAFYKRQGDAALGLFHANFLVSTSNLFIRRSLFESIGFFAPLRYTHDLEFLLRLLLGHKTIHFLDQPLLAYRLHEKNTIAENRVRECIERAAIFAYFLYRKWLPVGGDWQVSFERYAEVLAEQDLLEMVEEFLALFDGTLRQGAAAIMGSLHSELTGVLSRLGIDWAAHGSADGLLNRFAAARKVFLDRAEREQACAALKAQIEWLSGQRNAWEQQAHTNEEQFKATNRAVEELRSGNTWLLEQVKATSRAVEELQSGNTWLLEQRDAWEQLARTNEEQVKATNLALEELQVGNIWLLGQRDAWQQLAERNSAELAQSNAALTHLLDSPLFQLLVRTKLLELTYAPQVLTAPAQKH